MGREKTTFAREFLPREGGVLHFVNADLIASGLSPLRPEIAAVTGGRLFLAELDRLARVRADFAFEATLSGLTCLRRLKRWKAAGYRIEMIFLCLQSSRLALQRIRQLEHHIGQIPRSARILDVGCGANAFLYHLHRLRGCEASGRIPGRPRA